MFLAREIADAEGTFVQIYDASKASETSFATPDEFSFQVGFAVNAEDKAYVPHIHTDIVRTVTGTAEFIFVLAGRMDVTFLDAGAAPLGQASLTAQMGFLQVRGGHAISTQAGTRFFEIKQGPYAGRDADKYTVSLASSGEA